MCNSFQTELAALREATPSARKSLGEFKPLLVQKVRGVTRTEVLARAPSHNIDGNKTYARGLLFSTRVEAIAYAEETKQYRIFECIARAKKYGIDVD